MAISHNVELPLKEVLHKKAKMDTEIRNAITKFKEETGLMLTKIDIRWEYVRGTGYDFTLFTEVVLK